MNVLRRDERDVELRLSRDELVLINNALNEVCHGIEFSDIEFQTRLGTDRLTAKTLLDEFGAVYRLAFDAEKGSRH